MTYDENGNELKVHDCVSFEGGDQEIVYGIITKIEDDECELWCIDLTDGDICAWTDYREGDSVQRITMAEYLKGVQELEYEAFMTPDDEDKYPHYVAYPDDEE